MTPSEVRLVTIADREADIFEFLAEAADLHAEYVIRAAQDRRLKGEVTLLWTYMAQQDVAGEVRVAVPLYWRATPAEWEPFLRKPVSSITPTASGAVR